ncbi:FAD-dependent monooxygenase [Nocardia sp. 2]|uniref:FAD-dependent monooxygenase n=1 Tax=Nocardia acididurans TaxID=2802282 RepID=A0ABS1M8G9_9NOCA|nr:FAD-dependent monooxygenase [Nocardia acididurans]MBL1076435.1 FAD-dependent monooxygenase [Nocardia acididurans]
MSARPRVLIAGGGIGGLATALALQQAGIASSVFERAESLRDGGAGLHIWTNGALALARLGVLDRVLETAPVQRICHFGTWRGELFGQWPVADFIDRYGAPTVAIQRSALHAVLMAALAAGHPAVTVRSGAGVVGLAQDGAGVRVELSDGGTAHGDLLIGADGVHSTVRSLLFGPSAPRYNGHIAWRGIAELRHPLIPSGSFYGLFGPGTRFAFYDVAPGRVHWMSVANGPAGGRDTGDVKALLAQRHRGWMPPVADILAATPESAIIRNDVFDRKPDRRWGRGRVTLAGDAAHPITFNIGQGACQALEDALVLAEHLGGAVDLVVALRNYESERRRRTAPMQRIAYVIGRAGAVEHPLLIRTRETVQRVVWPRLAYRIAERKHISYGLRWREPAATLERRV